MTSFTSRSPGVIRTLDAGAGLVIPPVQAREDASLVDIAQAAFERENLIGSLLVKAGPRSGRPTAPVDPNFEPFATTDPLRRQSVTDNPFLHVAGYEDFLLDFIDARSPADILQIKKNIDRELRNRELLFDSGIVGFTAAMAGAILDPLIFIPGVGVVKGARGAVSLIRTGLRSAALSGGIVGTQELALQTTQATRTPTESIINTTGGAVLGGLLGAAIGKMTGRQIIQAATDLDDLTRMGTGPKIGVDSVTPPRHEPLASFVLPGNPELAIGSPPLIRTSPLLSPEPIAAPQLVPQRVHGPRALRVGQIVTHPKYGRGRVDSAPGHTPPRTPGVPEFNDVGRGLHDGQIVRLKGKKQGDVDFGVRILTLFRVGGRRVQPFGPPSDVPGLQAAGVPVPLQPAGKARVLLRDGNKRIIDITEIEGVEKLRTDRFNTNGDLVSVTFEGGPKTIRADLLTTNAGGKIANVTSLNAKMADVLDGTVPDPLEAGAMDLSRPVNLGGVDEFPGVKVQEQMAPDSTTTAVQLAQANGITLEKASFFGLDFNKIQRFLNPRIQLVMSKLGVTRSTSERLIEIPGRIKGDPVRSRSAEVEMRIRRAEARNVQLQVRELYSRYLTSDPGRTLRVREILFGFGRRTDKISERQFQQEIVKSLRGEAGPDGKAINFDIHEIPEVEAAAKLLRKKILNPVRDELVEFGILPANVKEFPGYLMRLYNRDLLRQVEIVDGKEVFAQREAFIDAVIGYRQKVAFESGKIADFREEPSRIAMGKVVDKLVGLPEGRLFPGDVPLRGAMLERTLDIPDSIIAPWLMDDGERIITSYVRTLVGDIEIIKRFGLAVERGVFNDQRAGLIKSIREAKTQRAAAGIIDDFRGGLVKRGHGGKKFVRVLRQGSQRRGINKPGVLAKRIRGAEGTADATKILLEQDTKLLSEFSTGNMELVLDRVETLWNRRIAQASKRSAKEANKLRRQRDNDLANLRLSRDEIRGLATLPEDPTHWAPRTLKVLRQWTVMSVGGKIAISSIPDLSLPIFNHGVADPRGFGRFLGAMLGDWDKIKLAKEDAVLSLGPSELYTNARSAQLFDIADDFHPRTRFERGVAKSTHIFSLANLMGPWNQAMRTISAAIVQQLIIRSARTISQGGALSKLARGRLAELGLGDDLLKKIFAQFEVHGGAGAGRGGVKTDMAPNIGAWTDLDVKRSFQAAVYRAYDLNVIKGSVLDRPKLFGKQNIPGMGDELSKTIFFFLNFGLSANARILGRGLQFRDAAFASGATLSIALGILSQWIKWQASGRKDPPADTLEGWVKLGVEQSGVSGFVFDADRVLEALSGGKVASSRIIPTFGGRRFYSAATFEKALFGLPFGTSLEAATTVGDVALSLDVDPEDVRRLRRLIPMQNLFWASRIFDQIQEKGERIAR